MDVLVPLPVEVRIGMRRRNSGGGGWCSKRRAAPLALARRERCWPVVGLLVVCLVGSHHASPSPPRGGVLFLVCLRSLVAGDGGHDDKNDHAQRPKPLTGSGSAYRR